MTINRKPITTETTLGQLLEAMAEAYAEGTPTGVFQSVAGLKSGSVLLFTVAISCEPYTGQTILPGDGGLTKQ